MFDRSEKLPSDSLGRPGGNDRGSRESSGGATAAILDRAMRSPGRPLPPLVHSRLSTSFGQDLGAVRIHSDGSAAAAAEHLDAAAFSCGSQVFFGAGRYAPGSPRGDWLLAHELAHVAQQSRSGGAVQGPDFRRRSGMRGGPFLPQRGASFASAEAEADAAADALTLFGGSNRANATPPIRIPVGRAIPRGAIQRQNKGSGSGPTPAQRLAAAKERLKKKFGLGDFEEKGAVWTQGQLSVINTAFSKLSPFEQSQLQGIKLVRVARIEPVVRKGKKVNVHAMTYGLDRIEFMTSALKDPDSALHEAGHAIHNRGVQTEEILHSMSRAGRGYEVASARMAAAQRTMPKSLSGPAAESVQQLSLAIVDATVAVGDVISLGGANLQQRIEALDSALLHAQLARDAVDSFKAEPGVAPVFKVYDRMLDLAAAARKYAEQKRANVTSFQRLDEFVGLVQKHKLARKSTPSFNDYVAKNWPEHPQEFFAESFAEWRKNPRNMKALARPIYEWFESGRHLRSSAPALAMVLDQVITWPLVVTLRYGE